MNRLFFYCLFLGGLTFATTGSKADCTLTNVGLIPLPDLGWGIYKTNFVGGLYPNGANTRPATHEAAGLRIAREEIQPLGLDGLPATNGAIVLISSGMSNTTQEWASKGTNNFTARVNRDPSHNPRLTIVDGAIGGQDAPQWTNINSPNWSTVLARITAAHASTNQVQVLWLKQAIAQETGPLTTHAGKLEGYLEIILHNAKTLFPNLKICYLSSRTRCYAYGSGLNPEPYAYETGFAVKWLIEKQLSGAPDLNYDSSKGPVVAPWLSWGPYIWTDGLRGRSDGLLSVCPDDLESDFTHPSALGGVPKVGSELLAFFKTDVTATPWFLRKNGIDQAPTCSPTADVTNGLVPLRVSFSANAADAEGPIRDYEWTFEDGTFSTNATPIKIFSAPGTYHAHLTVTDTNGNTASGIVIVNAQCTFDIWRRAKFLTNELTNPNISGATADPDSDGIQNRLEYALGLDPKFGNTATNGLPWASINNGVFTFSFTRLKAAADARVTAQTSVNLQSWSPAAPTRLEDNGLIETVTVQQPIGSASFIKLNVE